MPFTESQKIKINNVTGGNDKDDLKKCFFYPTTTPGEYNLYKKESGTDTLLVGGISSGSSFSFPLDTYTWTVPDPNQPNNPFVINAQNASGSWKNNDTSQPSIKEDSNGESGTFTAQAGGSIDAEEEAASSATA